jgi:hypothetical protein
VTDALGSVIRDVSDDERFLSSFGATRSKGMTVQMRDGFTRNSRRLSAPGARVLSISQLLMRPSAGTVSGYCQSSAGYTVTGIPSLDATFGWESGALSGGTRMTDGGHHFATWSADATGATVQAPLGKLSIARSGGGPSCPMMAPTFTVSGATASDTFSIPLTLTYRRGTLWNVNVSNAAFSGGESIDIVTSSDRKPIIAGVITKGSTELASLRTNVGGDGNLTITSTGAQYKISDWIVVGI